MDAEVARIAAAIGEPARARMLYSLMDNRARTATELAVVAEVSPSTASVHLSRLTSERLVTVLGQGRHRYYSLHGAGVASVLEALSTLAGGARAKFVSTAPSRLRAARTCYDHIAGALGVAIHERLLAAGWLSRSRKGGASFDVTPKGARMFESLGIDIESARALRRRFAFGCLDWSERRHHLGGAMGAALLELALTRKWVVPDLDSRALGVTRAGQRELVSIFGLDSGLLSLK